MKSDPLTKTHRPFDESQYCGHCGLPLARCAELGGEEWHELWDDTVEGVAGGIADSLHETMEG